MIDNVLEYFKKNEVICKIVEDNRIEYGDFIAVFGYGKLTRKEIVKEIKNNNLLCMFFEGVIRQNKYNKKIQLHMKNWKHAVMHVFPLTSDNKIVKKELLDKLANLPDDTEIAFSAWDYEKLDDGTIRKYSLYIESIDVIVLEDRISIRLNGENHYE